MFNSRKKNTDPVHDKFFVQNVDIKKVESRLDMFRQYCNGKSVLHFGCTDYPIFDPGYNLHIHLNTYVEDLSGFDIDEAGIEILKKYVDKPYFSKIDQVVDKHFDVCLIPETIEHVDNIQLFLNDISRLNCTTFIITAPNCFAPNHINRNKWINNTFEEIIHPDHNCWFSAYTLNNVIKKYTNLTPVETYLLEGETMVCVVSKK
jgi:hypothetical protein